MPAFDWEEMLEAAYQRPRDRPKQVVMPDGSSLGGMGELADPADAAPMGRMLPPEPEPEEPLPEPSAPMASNDPGFRPPHAGQGEPQEESYDWRRMLSSLFGGREGVSDYDRQKLAAASQRMQQQAAGERSKLSAAQEKRAQGRYEMERDAATAAKQEKAAKDKSARDLAAERITAAATRINDAPLKASALHAVGLLRAPDSVATAQVAQEIARQFGADISDHLRGERQDSAQGEKEAARKERDAQAWAKINRIGSGAGERKSDRIIAQQAKNQEKLDTEIENAQWAQDILLDVRRIKGDVDTGPVAGRVQNAAQEYLGLSTEAFDKMKVRLSQVANRIIKELSGSAVTGNEWMRMQDELANMNNNDGNFLTKLANMIELTEAIKQKAVNRYSRGADGAPSNPTNTAKTSTAQKPSVMPGETPPPDKTPGADQKAKNRARAQQIVDDPNEDPKKKAKAKLWLEQNP